MAELWRDWIPGVLSKNQVVQLCKANLIRNVSDPDAVADASSIDLHLSDEVFELTSGSVKPFSDKPFFDTINGMGLLEKVAAENGYFHLHKKKTYLVKLRERLAQDILQAKIYGRATAKSSVGRVDVLVRLIVDNMRGYDFFDPGKSEGDLCVEITPISFDVRIKPDISLSQLRLFYGHPREAEISGQAINETCLRGSEGDEGLLSLTLEPDCIGGIKVSAFKGGETENGAMLDLWKDEDNGAEPWKYFRFLDAPDGRLLLEPGSFYILRSKERLTLPNGIAVYCKAIDETLGEMRIHYAGFAHPWFGRNRDDDLGTPLIFEVRGHDFRVVLLEGERMAKLTFYRMSVAEDAPQPTPYDTQELQISKFFKKFPNELEWVDEDDGTVQPKAKE